MDLTVERTAAHDSTETTSAVGESAVGQAVLDAFAPAWRHDPYPSYEVLRAAGPFPPGPLNLRLVPRYAECNAILQNPAWSHAEEPELLHPGSDILDLPASFLWMEPPDHTRLRGLVSKAFTLRTIENLRPRVEQVVDELVDQAVAAGEVDLIEALAYPLPLTMICELLGVPADDHPTVRRMSEGIARGLDPDVLLTPEEVAARTEAAREFIEFFGALIAQRRAQPRDDLISALAAVEAEGDRLAAHEMLATLVVLVVAGHETTVNLVGNGVLALLRNPDQFALLRDNPDLAGPAVDELLRYDAPSQLTTRVATREIELSGHTFVPGDGVMVMLGSANRDPHAFDEPDRLDLTRYTGRDGVNRHMSFGIGLHYCIGAPLVRLEMEIALRALAGRAPAIELLADPPVYRPNLVVRGMTELPVRFTG